MLIKVYKANPEAERKYSRAEVSSVEVVPVSGRPDPDRICTSIIERSNLSLRMDARRWTRDECLQQEVGKPFRDDDALVLLLQFLPDTQIITDHARDGGGDREPGLGRSGSAGGLAMPAASD